MRILTLPFTLARLPIAIAKSAWSAAGDLLGGDGGEPTSVRVPPEPRVFRPPATPKPAPGDGGAPPASPGAEVHVDEPWPGYRRMTAAEITARLRTATPALAATVSLYEAGAKGRSSVLQAAARRTSA